MNYIKPELVQKAKEVDLYTYLQTNNPDELIHVSGNEYKLKSHGSLRISNGKWNWWSHAIGGKSALDYLMKVENIDFKNAVLMIVGDNKAYESQVKPQEKQSEKATSKELKLPEKNDTVKVIYRYLLNRGIDKQILSKCISDGIIYESKEHHNVIFVGRDEHNIPRYGAWRAANDSRLMGDCFGSDKRFSFQLSGKNEESAHFFESAIDALSYASILKMKGKNWQDVNLISLAGVAATQKESSESKLPLALS